MPAYTANLDSIIRRPASYVWRHLLHPRGWQIGPHHGSSLLPYRIFRLDTSTLARHSVSNQRHRYRIEIDWINSRTAFSFSEDGWHPFSETLEQYRANRHLKYEHSALYQFYQTFKPNNVQDVIVGNESGRLSPIADWPPTRELYTNVWILDSRSVSHALQNSAKRKARQDIFIGPLSHQAGLEEFERLCRVFDGIETYGYQESRADSPIEGYFLADGDEIRFIVLSGNHRVAALRALGHTKVTVQLRNRQPPVLHSHRLDRWMTDRGGLYPTNTAAMLFAALWYGRRRTQAESLGSL